MSGTEIAYGAICLRPRYAMSGSDLAVRIWRRQACPSLSRTPWPETYRSRTRPKRYRDVP
eukprot:3941078-Rhodomonas_salina.4